MRGSHRLSAEKRQRYIKPCRSPRGLYPETAVEEIIRKVTAQINESPELEVEYFEVVRARDLLPASPSDANETVVGCIAVYAGDVRLIDNLKLNS